MESDYYSQSNFHRIKITSIPYLKILLLFILFNQFNLPQTGDFFIRLNQVGYLPDDIKTGVILSEKELPANQFIVVDEEKNIEVYSGETEPTAKRFGKFTNNYYLECSDFTHY